MTLLLVQDVSVRFGQAAPPALHGLSFSLQAGEMLALVGQSGSGKSTTALAIPRLLPAHAVISGRIALDGADLAALPPAALRHARATQIGMVFQDPLAALNPAMRVGEQIAEPIRRHTGASRAEAWARAVALLGDMGMSDPAARARDYPQQFSGGMRQRVIIAGALACAPKLLIADEPTTGLDPVLTSFILDLLARLCRQRGLAVLLVSHDLALVARRADRVLVLHQGALVEQGTARGVLASPAHQATRALRDASLATPRATGPVLPAGDLLRVENLSVTYGAGFGAARADTPALRDASFALRPGECLGVAGASGSGKTTLGRAVLHMLPYQGRVVLNGVDLAGLRGRALRQARRRIQVVFQNPASSLNPLMTVGETIGEAWRFAQTAVAPTPARMADLLRQVGLAETLLGRRPATLSGGQAQRVAIARALAAEPDLIVLDEPTSSLDSTTQAALLALLADLARRRGLGYIVITHDLAVLRRLAHRIAVLHQGEIVELEDAETLIRAPSHPVTAALIAASSLPG